MTERGALEIMQILIFPMKFSIIILAETNRMALLGRPRKLFTKSRPRNFDIAKVNVTQSNELF